MKNVLRQRKFQALAATAVVAGAGAAAAIMPAISASASQDALATTTPRCGNSAVTAWIGEPGSAAAGSAYYELELSNISGHTCTLYGFPGVSAVGTGGVQLGSPAARQAGDAERVVTLTPGATAHALLQVANTGNFPRTACVPKTAAGLKVYAPGDTAAKFIPFTFSACSKPGDVFLHVRTTVAGTGIPGFSA
jgi:hypothetical protein